MLSLFTDELLISKLQNKSFFIKINKLYSRFSKLINRKSQSKKKKLREITTENASFFIQLNIKTITKTPIELKNRQIYFFYNFPKHTNNFKPNINTTNQ